MYDGRVYLDLVTGASERLRSVEHELNRINVFPVADGDTGTNLRTTLELVVAAIDPPPFDTPIGEIARQVARAAVMGARGNSGVMVAQVFQGMAQVFGAWHTCSAADFAVALSGASQLLDRTLADPVEGTLLTAARWAADAALVAPADDLWLVLDYATRAAHSAAEASPASLPILRRHGVMDAGALGMYHLLWGMRERAAMYGGLPRVALDPLQAQYATDA